MSSVFLDITMSLDGFIAEKNDNVERLHDWILDFKTGVFKKSEAMDELFERTGAIVAGSRVYELASGWHGNHPVGGVPVYVLSHDRPDNVPQGGTVFTFIPDGIEAAVREAKSAAGEKDVYVMGGADIAQQCLKAALLDEIHLHIAPILLTEGIRLFDHLGSERIQLELNRISESKGITHLTYRVIK